MIETVAPDARFYDNEWTHSWEDMKAFGPVARHTRRLIARHLDRLWPFDSLVDIGCGNGEFLSSVRLPSPVRVSGVDFSGAAVQRAARRLSGAFHQLDIERQALSSTSDVGVCSEVLEHLQDDRAALRNIYRMCRTLIVTVPPR